MNNLMGNVPPVTKNLIIMNIIIFAIMNLVGLGNMFQLLGLHYPKSDYFRPYQLVTHLFIHGSVAHIFFNMFGLYMFGSLLERFWGPQKFLFYYIFCGLGGAAFHIAFEHYNFIQTLKISDDPAGGASGAIFGLLGAFGFMFPNNELRLLFPPIAMKAKYFITLYAIFELSMGVSGAEAGVAHFAHLGGLFFGLGLLVYWKYKGKIFM